MIAKVELQILKPNILNLMQNANQLNRVHIYCSEGENKNLQVVWLFTVLKEEKPQVVRLYQGMMNVQSISVSYFKIT